MNCTYFANGKFKCPVSEKFANEVSACEKPVFNSSYVFSADAQTAKPVDENLNIQKYQGPAEIK